MTTKGNLYFGLEIEGHRAPSAFRSKKVENKNYFKENFKKLRQLQKINKQQNECSQPVKALWKSSKYENVESKLKGQLENMFGHSATSGTNRNFLRAHSRTGFIPASARASSPVCNKNESQVPSRASTAREGKNVDYIKLNGCAIKRYSLKKSPSLGNLEVKQNVTSHLPGEIPQYLIDRRNQWLKEEEDRRKKLKEAEIPRGHRLMSEQERIDTLEKARQKREELSSQLGRLPLRNDTTRIRAIKDELEMKLSEVEQSMKKLSKPKVYVVLES